MTFISSMDKNVIESLYGRCSKKQMPQKKFAAIRFAIAQQAIVFYALMFF